MTLRHLRIFLAVCDSGKVTEAANQLFMTQPAVSLAISELESHYGVMLFDRISRRLHITQRGEQLRQYAAHIVALSDEAEQQMANRDASGLLRVGGSITVGSTFLAELIGKFQEIGSEIQVSVQISTSQAIEQAILQNKLDIGIVERKVENPYLKTELLVEDELVFLCKAGHPLSGRRDVTVEELLHYPLLLREEGSASRDALTAQLELLEQPCLPRWESVSNTSILTATAQGLGVSYLPKALARRALDGGKVVTFHVPELENTRQMTLIYHKNKFITPALERFISLCNQVFDKNNLSNNKK